MHASNQISSFRPYLKFQIEVELLVFGLLVFYTTFYSLVNEKFNHKSRNLIEPQFKNQFRDDKPPKSSHHTYVFFSQFENKVLHVFLMVYCIIEVILEVESSGRLKFKLKI